MNLHSARAFVVQLWCVSFGRRNACPPQIRYPPAVALRGIMAWFDTNCPRPAQLPRPRPLPPHPAIRRGAVVASLPGRSTRKEAEEKLEPKKEVNLTRRRRHGAEGHRSGPAVRVRRACRSSCCMVSAAPSGIQPLADYLQEQGFAVIATDLRGHGESTLLPDTNRPLLAADMPLPAFAGMIDDVEATKQVSDRRGTTPAN